MDAIRTTLKRSDARSMIWWCRVIAGDKARRMFEEVLKTREVLFETVRRPKNDSNVHVDVSMRTVRDTDGSVTG
jgi:hypothetical protein